MVNKLSRGMQQKVAIAMTLICHADVILLDEPTLGLDVQSHLDIKDILMDIGSDLDKTILLFRPAADKVFLSMMGGYSLIDFRLYDYGIMIGNSILYFGIGLLVFNTCVKIAKRKALLGQY